MRIVGIKGHKDAKIMSKYRFINQSLEGDKTCLVIQSGVLNLAFWPSGSLAYFSNIHFEKNENFALVEFPSCELPYLLIWLSWAFISLFLFSLEERTQCVYKKLCRHSFQLMTISENSYFSFLYFSL